MNPKTPSGLRASRRTAVVISGAGARGAYEAAVMAKVLPRILPDLSSTLFLGTSSGAINAALWAAHATAGKSVQEVGNEVLKVWRGIAQDRVFVNPARSSLRLPFQHTAFFWKPIFERLAAPVAAPVHAAAATLEGALKPLTALLPGFIRSSAVDAADAASSLGRASSRVLRSVFDEIPGLLDTRPLFKTADEVLNLGDLHANVRAGRLLGVGVVATSCPLDCSGGRSRVFVELHDERELPDSEEDSSIDYVGTKLTAASVLASAAIPVAFPAIQVRVRGQDAYSGYYVDGGVRLNTPIKPAVALDVDRIIVISSHATTYPTTRQAEAGTQLRPDVLDIGALTIHASLADGMIEDLRSLKRANRQVEEARQRGESPPRSSEGRPYRQIELIEIAPDNGVLPQIARAALAELDPKHKLFTYGLLSWLLTGAGRGIGNDELLSYLLFEPEYFERQFKQGFEDAKLVLKTLGVHRDNGRIASSA